MPTDTHRFPATAPIHLHLRSGRGTVLVLAGDGDETVVEVTGRHEGELARVSASDDGRRVTVDVPRHRRFGNAPRLDITVHLRTGSTLDLGTASAGITVRGAVAQAEVRSASGAVSVEQVSGDAHVKTASGDVELGTVDGAATVKSASGDLRIATCRGRCGATTASGAVDIGWAGSAVSAGSASGDVTVRDVSAGSVSLKSTSGDVIVGVRPGTLVWLDLTTVSGRTTSNLSPDQPTGDAGEVLRLDVKTVSGDITVSPSAAGSAAA
jgi:DUF4097 and DUF4098 domain-containing protein YvlB